MASTLVFYYFRYSLVESEKKVAINQKLYKLRNEKKRSATQLNAGKRASTHNAKTLNLQTKQAPNQKSNLKQTQQNSPFPFAQFCTLNLTFQHCPALSRTGKHATYKRSKRLAAKKQTKTQKIKLKEKERIILWAFHFDFLAQKLQLQLLWSINHFCRLQQIE